MLKAIPVSYLTPIQKTALLMIFKGTGRISQTYLQAQAQEEAGSTAHIALFWQSMEQYEALPLFGQHLT